MSLLASRERQVALALRQLAMMLHSRKKSSSTAGAFAKLAERRRDESWEDRLIAWRRGQTQIIIAIGLGLLALGGVQALADLRSYALLTRVGVELKPNIPPYRPVFESWTKVRVVELGCTKSRRSGPKLAYTVWFIDGASYAITGNEEYRVPFLDSLETVDALLREAGVPIQRSKSFAPLGASRTCLQKWAERLGPDGFARLAKLFGLTAEEARAAIPPEPAPPT